MYQTDPPRSPQEFLPTMYDLPSEDPEETGLPDEYHLIQPQLLRETFTPSNYPVDQVFNATDFNLYYDVRHPLWYKRPDWFAVVNVPRLYQQKELRLSYVTWQEGVNPFIVVELLSPGTEKEDLGQILRDANQPPTKWEVYERILRVPYYVVFDRYTDHLRAFQLVGSSYAELDLRQPRLWLNDIELGLGLWQGVYQGSDRLWLRWYDAQGNWILTAQEQERKQVEKERRRVERLAEQLRALGIEPDLGDEEE
ncbi:MAG: Uma2 family endonuclease [Trichormus sp. ATA11-4-KO1]|nr:Uma2 family endonuclease [Trichormus sp. ATA11-4-KO1]